MTQQLNITYSINLQSGRATATIGVWGACAEDVRRSLEDLSPEGVMIR